MKCTACGSQNREDSNFCISCGSALLYACPICRKKAESGDVYCSHCGFRLPSAQGLSALPAPKKSETQRASLHASDRLTSERRTVTVLFADLSGFTAMSERLDPEEVTTIMNNCLQIMGDTVTAYEGYIDKFIGDCIMALFGAPITHENDPELALRAALEMSKKIDDYNKKLPIKLEKPLSLHIGINTGIVVAGKLGSDARMDYTVMGDTVNLASRLESNATHGQIFVSAYTHNQTKKLFEFIERDPITVKGKMEPVAVYEVVRVLDISEIKASSVSDIPLIGRAKEIEALSTSVERLKNGEGQTVFLISDPGFGKSRIQIELKNKFKQQNAQIIEGRCQSYGKNTAYHTFIDMFKRMFAIDSDDLASTITTKLTDGLPLLVGEDKVVLSAEAKRAIVFIGRLFDLDLAVGYDVLLSEMSPQEIHTATIRSIGWLFSSFGRQKATIISIEDVHNADDATVEAIAALISACKTVPIMLLLLLRPDKNSSVTKLLPLARRTLGDRAIEMTFEHLNRNECEAFVKHALGSENLPKELMDLIGLRSEGNPLFLNEIIKSLLDQGAIEKHDGEVVVKKELSTVLIPDSITGLIITRFDKLSPVQREIMSKAAVLGTSFSRRLIEEIVHDNELNSALNALVESEMIFESQSFPDIEYSFHTTFIQEAVYGTLLLKRRQSLHQEAAEAIRGLFGERLQDHVESLAMHYAQSGDLSNAYYFTVQSGMKAKAVYSNVAAAKFFGQAIELGQTLDSPEPAIITLYKPYSEVLELLGDTQGAIVAWEHIMNTCTDSFEKADAMRNIGRIEEKRGSKDKSIKIYHDAIALISDFQDSLEYALLLMNLSWVMSRFRKNDEALGNGLKALGIFEKLQSNENIALCCNNLAVFYENSNDFETALSFNLRSLTLFQEARNRRQIANVELSLGYLRTKMGESDLALKHFTRSAEIMNMIGNRTGSAAALLAKGRLYADIGKNEEAEIALLSALNDFKDIGSYRKTAATLISLIQVLLDKNETKGAYKYLEEALNISQINNFLSEEGKLTHLHARALRHDERVLEAKEKYKEAIKIFEKLGRVEDVKTVTKELDGLAD
jgi:class 3 adenylate cyclase/tetratricopeptide (TPR) repeat protein/predicted RNA-binding Zn-ribbon protein involved in translation (DUF1610 family)